MQFTAKTGAWITGLLLVVLASVCLYKIRSFADGFKQAEQGAEYPAAEQQAWFEGLLSESFGWTGLPPSSLERAWSNGFQDHIWLLRVKIAPEIFDDLRQSVLASKTEGIEIDDQGENLMRPFDIATTKSAERGDIRIPDWWEGSSAAELDRLSWSRGRTDGWFGYNRKSGILHVLVSTR